MADDLATVERIYEVAKLPMTDQARSEIVRYLDTHQRGSNGQVHYDLRNDFGATPSEVRASFDFYLEKFPVKVEVS